LKNGLIEHSPSRVRPHRHERAIVAIEMASDQHLSSCSGLQAWTVTMLRHPFLSNLIDEAYAIDWECCPFGFRRYG